MTHTYFFYHQKNLFIFSHFRPDVIKSGLEDLEECELANEEGLGE